VSYNTQALVANDSDLITRVTACAATQNLFPPSQWAWERQWRLATQPGWADAWDYAIANGNARPGHDEGVITDAMILSAVQAIVLAKQ
jgi:hypothetical protein